VSLEEDVADSLATTSLTIVDKKEKMDLGNWTRDESTNFKKNIANWSKEDVYYIFKNDPNLSKHAENFLQQSVTGLALLELLKKEDQRNGKDFVDLGIEKVGERLHLVSLIRERQKQGRTFQRSKSDGKASVIKRSKSNHCGNEKKVEKYERKTRNTVNFTEKNGNPEKIVKDQTTCPSSEKKLRKDNRFGDGLDVPRTEVTLFYDEEYLPTESPEEILHKFGFVGYTAIQDVSTRCSNDSYGLSVMDKAIIHLYTMESPFYTKLNSAMRSRNNSELEQFRPYIFYLNQVLNRLPICEKPVYRAINSTIDHYKPGMTITWDAFSSATSNPRVAMHFIGNLKNGTFFMISPKNARIIKDYSAHPDEDEMIFPPNCKFEVTEIGTPTRSFIEEAVKEDLSKWVFYQLKEV